MRYLVSILPLFICHLNALGQTASFSGPNETCLNEEVAFQNTTMDGVEYIWDFCLDDLNEDGYYQELMTLSNASQPNSIALYYDSSNWYGFITNRGNHKLIRLDFGSDLSNPPDEVDMGTLGGNLNIPVAIELVKENNNWYGLLVNNGNNKVLRLDFGTDITNSNPSVTDLGGFSKISGPFDLSVSRSSDGDVYAIIGNFTGKNATIIDFGNSIVNTPNQSTDVLNIGNSITLSNVFGVAVEQIGTEWFGVLSSYGDGKYYKMAFGSDLLSEPAFTQIGTITAATEAFIVKEGKNYYTYCLGRNTGLYRYDFGSTLANPPTEGYLGTYGGKIQEVRSFSLVRSAPSWDAFVVGFSNQKLHHISFDRDCSLSISINSYFGFEPSDLSYKSSGEYDIELTVFDEYGNMDSTQKSIEVLAQIAPDIDFTTTNQCIDGNNLFESINSSGDISGYSWDFDDDGMEDSGLENPELSLFDDFGLGAGDHPVTLTVSNGSCENTVSKIVSIYNSPVAGFDAPVSNICTNTALNFTNTSTYDPAAPITFSWDFNEDDIEDSNEESPSYIFNSPGEYRVRLVVSLPDGCSDTTEQIIDLQEGPEIGFDWTHNCFGEAVQFNNTSQQGEGITYAWDFGDEIGTSSDQYPTYIYSTADDYTITLVVDDGNCTSELQKEIYVNNQPLVAMDFANGTENLPVSFSGNDLTLTGDSVVSWFWDFGGLGNSFSQDTSFTFSDPDSYSISLNIETAQGCMDQISSPLAIEASQNATADFLISDACMLENIEIENLSSNAQEYTWDFCFESLNTTPALGSTNVNSSFIEAEGIEILKDGPNWHGFISSRQDGKLYRLDFGSSLQSNEVDTTEVTITGDTWTSLKDIRFVEEDGNWFGVATTYSNHKLYRLSLGPTLDGDGVATDLGNLDGWNTLRGVDLVRQGSDVIAIISSFNNNKVSLVRFPGGITNVPEVLTVSDSEGYISGPIGVSLINDGSNWYGLLASYSNDNVLLLDFGAGLFSDPDITVLNNVTLPTAVRLVKEGSNYIGFVSQRNLGLKRYHFGVELSNGLDSISQLVIQDADLSNVFAISIEKDLTEWHLFAQNTDSDRTIRLDFLNGQCQELNQSTSAEAVPSGLVYSAPGDYLVELTAVHDNGNFDVIQKTITITENTAPDIDFTFISQCISNPTSFTPITSSSSITTYSWDFDSDGTEDSDEENPAYQFPSAGTYTVRLDVQSDEGCGNFTTQEITIYEEPPLPSFTIAKDSFCIGEEVILSNLTVDADWDDLIEYHWIITDLDEIVEATPGVSFSTSGQKILTVYASIPGCESEVVSDTIQVIGIPATDFSFNNSCFGEEVAFTNESDVGSYVWDFGDGQSSVESDPTHLYDSPGTYQVDLTVTDNLGCDHTERKELVVAALPEPGFEYDLVCVGNEATFQDISVVDQADIVAWEWYADDELISEDQAPTLTFEESGEKLIRLIVYSSHGCEATYMEYVDVLAVPGVDFSIEQGCIGETTTFTDLSMDQGEIQSRTWEINGQQFDQPEVDYVFTEPGTYEVELMVMNNNFCLASTTREVEIKQLPIPDFHVFGVCENETIELVDNSTEYNDLIDSRTWELDGQVIGTGKNAVLPETNPGEHILLLRTLTASGCVTESSQSFDLKEKPYANFRTSNDYGVPPFSLNVTNQTTNGTVHEWYIDNELITTATNPALHFESAGDKEVKLISYNQAGCSDTVSTVILSKLPEIDLKIIDMQLEEDGSTGHVLLNVMNSSNLPIEAIEVNIDLQNQFSISEQVYQRIEVGEEAAVSLNTGIPLVNNNLAYLCITLSSAYSVNDTNPVDNEKCINLEPRIISEPPYPNPVESLTRLRVIIPENGGASLSVFDVSGQMKITEEYPNLEQGLNQFTIDMSPLDPGTYFIRFNYQEKTMVSRILKL